MLQIFHVLAAIIERLGADVQPFTSGFLQLLPTVWQQAEGQQLVQMQVIASLNRACFCIKSDKLQLVMPVHQTKILACLRLQQKEQCPALPHCLAHSSAQLLVACPYLPVLTPMSCTFNALQPVGAQCMLVFQARWASSCPKQPQCCIIINTHQPMACCDQHGSRHACFPP